MSEDQTTENDRPAVTEAGRWTDRIVRGLALIGGLLLAALGIMQVLSIVLRASIGKPIQGDFELIQLGTAVVVFCFLPISILHRHNFIVSLLTDHLPARAQRVLAAIASIVFLAIAAILLWRMSLGSIEIRAVGEHTLVLGLPIWWALVPIMVAVVILVVASAAAVRRDLGELGK